MERLDYIVIGGGIVGLSAAWAILEKYPLARIAVLEKEAAWAAHQTGRNSGVIHSGIYYKPGSLKAALCREGNRRLREFCDEQGVRYDVCGKVIVATNRAELPSLNRLHERGRMNGLEVTRLHPADVREFEPNVQCIEGLHVPSTGIVNYTEICLKLAELLERRGGLLRADTKVERFCESETETILETSAGEFAASWVVNCAGLHSDRVARLAGVEPEAKIVPFRGEYYELKPERRDLVRGLIYPVPDPRFPFLGVHLTRMIDGSVHAGPNAVLSFKREGYERTSFDLRDAIDTLSYRGFWRMAARHAAMGLGEMYRSFSKRAFVRGIQRLVPSIQEEDLIPSQAGVRAQALRRDGCLVDDFLIVPDRRATHVCNAPSPAATSSLEIGRLVAEQIPDVTPERVPSCSI